MRAPRPRGHGGGGGGSAGQRVLLLALVVVVVRVALLRGPGPGAAAPGAPREPEEAQDAAGVVEEAAAAIAGEAPGAEAETDVLAGQDDTSGAQGTGPDAAEARAEDTANAGNLEEEEDDVDGHAAGDSGAGDDDDDDCASRPARFDAARALRCNGLWGGGAPGVDSHVILASAAVSADGVAAFTGDKGRPSKLRIEPELAGRLPARDWAARLARKPHATCAIVGNSGTLLGSKFGQEIDAHDAVMRINYAPIEGFAADVGTRTTYDFSNRENARRLLTSHVQWRDSTVIFFETASPTNRKKIFLPLLAKFPSKKLQFLHPSFIVRGLRQWYEFKAELERRKGATFHDKPMSGYYAVMLMMQLCERIDMYGFEPYTSKRHATAPYHYFDKVEGVTSVHSFDFAIYVYELISSEVMPVSVKKARRSFS